MATVAPHLVIDAGEQLDAAIAASELADQVAAAAAAAITELEALAAAARG